MICRFKMQDAVGLGAASGKVVAGTQAGGDGLFEFAVTDGTIRGQVLKARGPDVALAGVRVWLVQEMWRGVAVERYAVLVDDGYWGVRVQGTEFRAAPFEETFVMGYRLQGRVLENGVAVASAQVSLETELATETDGRVVFWDSQEYNELVYSEELETWVEGPVARTPIETDEDGEWEFIAPKGHGAIYQRQGDRRDDCPETALRALERTAHVTYAVHRGVKAVAREGQWAVIDLRSSSLRIVGTPGAWVLAGTMDDAGQAHEIPQWGEVTLSGLPACEHSVVQFRRTGWGAWDSTAGCARKVVTLEPGLMSTVVMGALEEYPLEELVYAGRVYLRPGVPAAGMAIKILDLETYTIVGTAATTDEGGFWSAELPPTGFGGELVIHDETWGSVPVLGAPYSDVVLGARMYSSWFDEYRPEAWRKGDFGHKNFPWVPESIWVEDPETQERFETIEASYGGWVTEGTLPKFRFVEDLEELVYGGPVLREYALVEPAGVIATGLVLGTQPFEGWETAPGLYRATGYYPEAKMLLGGKVHGNVVAHGDAAIGAGEPEAARMGLEFGAPVVFGETRCGPRDGQCDVTSVTGLLCPYCGGPAHRDPGTGVAEQGYCEQCADVFGDARAMDCRTFFRTPTMGGTGRRMLRVFVPARDTAAARMVRHHWRPEIYEETDGFVSQSGPVQPTNAPRWIARHVDQFGDGKGFGRFDGDGTPMFTAGHGMSYFEGLPEIGRELGVAQLKAVFEPGYVTPVTFAVDVDCELVDGTWETRRVTIPAGSRGPCTDVPLGDAVRFCLVPKLKAEMAAAPYRGVGLYTGVRDIRLVSPASAPGCRFRVVGDAPFLADAAGPRVVPRRSVPTVVQADRLWGNPCLAQDRFGQIFAAYCEEGDIRVHRRAGMAGNWDGGTRVTNEGVRDEPALQKDGTGGLVLAMQRGDSQTRVSVSRDDWRSGEA